MLFPTAMVLNIISHSFCTRKALNLFITYVHFITKQTSCLTYLTEIHMISNYIVSTNNGYKYNISQLLQKKDIEFKYHLYKFYYKTDMMCPIYFTESHVMFQRLLFPTRVIPNVISHSCCTRKAFVNLT